MTETTTIELKNDVRLEVQCSPTSDVIQLLVTVGGADDPSTVHEEMLDAVDRLIEADRTPMEMEASYCDREVWERVAEYYGDVYLYQLLEEAAKPMIEQWETENEDFLSLAR